MGLFRKALFLSTGGISGLFIGLNSKKERIAKAAEEQARIMAAHATQEARFHEKSVAHERVLTLDSRQEAMTTASQLERLAELYRSGALTDEEFAAAKMKVIYHRS